MLDHFQRPQAASERRRRKVSGMPQTSMDAWLTASEAGGFEPSSDGTARNGFRDPLGLAQRCGFRAARANEASQAPRPPANARGWVTVGVTMMVPVPGGLRHGRG